MRTALAILLVFFAFALVTIEGLSIGVSADLPDFTTRDSTAWEWTVTALSSQAAAAGLRVGDHIDWALSKPPYTPSLADPRLGVPFVLPVVRGNRLLRVSLMPVTRPRNDLINAILDVPLKTIGFVLAVLLVARGRGRFGICAGLAVFGIFAMEGYAFRFSILPSFGPYGASTLNVLICGVVFRYFLVEAMIAMCGEALRNWEKWAFRFITAAGSLCIAFPVVGNVAYLFGAPPVPEGPWFTTGLLAQRVAIFGFAIPLIRPSPVDRRLVAWVFWTMLIGFAGGTANLILGLLGLPIPAYGALNFCFLIMAFGMAYVALRYRVVDISFVANRALVYALIVTLLAIVLAVSEQLVERLAISGFNSFAIETVVAVLLGVSLKRVERWAEHVVDRFIFAKKYATDEGLRALFHDCSHIDDANHLADLVCVEIQRLLGAKQVAIYERQGALLCPIGKTKDIPGPPSVSTDDAVVVRMRSSHVPVELGTLESVLGSGIVFPMLARGRLVGFLQCGMRTRDAIYDPSERALLADLAHEVGTTLLLLRAEAVP